MYRNIAEIKAANKACGSHWFDRGSMAFFETRISDELINGRYFVTTEKCDSGPRRATIRRAENNGHVSTVGDFQAYDTIDKAKRAARKLGA